LARRAFIVRLFFSGGRAMPKIKSPFHVYKRSDTKKFVVTLNPGSGLPGAVCNEWRRSSFANFPPALSHLREPKSKSAADNAAMALIEYLKKEAEQKQSFVSKPFHAVAVGAWLLKFTSLEDNPRSARLMAEGFPYSPDTIDGYAGKYARYLKEDPLMHIKMADVEESDILAFIGRLGNRKNKFESPIAGTRTFEITLRFVRMAFHEFQLEHRGWANPFVYIKPPRTRENAPPDAITGDELARLFFSGAFETPLQKAVCAAMFFAGLRRSEIFALRPEDLDWETPRIKVVHAWKRFSSKTRELGDPKWHKTRDTIFPEQLQQAIRELWAAYGKHEFVFSRKDGTLPGSNYIRLLLPKWLEKAGIKVEGRRIVPHSSRHSTASILESDGVSLRYIQKLLGHSRMETTKGYLHEPAQTMNRIGKKMSKAIVQQEEQSHENRGIQEKLDQAREG
jgi:integrase